ncbi:MAG TPA: DUF1501 domain-containing protein [Pirellulales bacterium]
MESLRHVCSQPTDRSPWASATEFHRRQWLGIAAAGTIGWLTPAAQLLAEQTERRPHEPAQSLILLWLAGGPSQLETFDPHPGRSIAGGSRAIDTAVRGVQLAAGLEQLAAQLGSVALVRNLVSKEGDHQRGTYLLKTGYRPDPTVVHPAIGAICCHQLAVGKTEIPRHVSILSQQWPGRGGLLGNQYDAFQTGDPQHKVPDISAAVDAARIAARLANQRVVDAAFAVGRPRQVESTLHAPLMARARQMMTSEQLAAFDVLEEPAAVRASYGDTPFGRGCLAARRLIEVGVRCVEVTLSGWDTHTNNHETHAERVATLDPAIAGLLADLRSRGLLEKTIVMCGGEFGRTPQINRLDGRDHWPHGFGMLLAGGRIRGGYVHGQTDPEGKRLSPAQGTSVADLHATVLTALGIDPAHEEMAAIGRPIKLSEGEPLTDLLA